MSGNTKPVLWWENSKGEKFYPNLNDVMARPEGFDYQVYRNPLEVHDSHHGPEGHLLSGRTTYPASLVTAQVGPTVAQRLTQLWRNGFFLPRVPLDEAILKACACERCINAFAYDYGLDWGYRRFSAAWKASRTECEYCAHLGYTRQHENTTGVLTPVDPLDATQSGVRGGDAPPVARREPSDC